MAKDPICGMTVDEATALRAEREGETFYFCSEHCREKFLAQPATTKPHSDSNHSHSCCGGHAKQAPTEHDSEHTHSTEELNELAALISRLQRGELTLTAESSLQMRGGCLAEGQHSNRLS